MHKILVYIVFISVFIDGLRIFGIPIYDISILCVVMVIFIKSPYLNSAIFKQPLAIFLLYYTSVCFVVGAPLEAIRYIFALLFFIFGWIVGQRKNQQHVKRIYFYLIILIIPLALLNINVPRISFGPLEFSGSFGKAERFSFTFSDPNKLAAFFYIPLAAGLLLYRKQIFLIMLACKTRFGILYIIL